MVDTFIILPFSGPHSSLKPKELIISILTSFILHFRLSEEQPYIFTYHYTFSLYKLYQEIIYLSRNNFNKFLLFPLLSTHIKTHLLAKSCTLLNFPNSFAYILILYQTAHQQYDNLLLMHNLYLIL